MSHTSQEEHADWVNQGLLKANEELTVDQLPVTGIMPTWLHGTLLRNGPGKIDAGNQRFRHWFDGYAMLHKFSFQNGQVSYAGKFLETKAHQTAEEEGRITYTEFATDPCRSLFQRAMAVFNHNPTDNAKVSIAHFADHFIALTETPIQVEFDTDTLKSVGVFNFEEELVGQMTTAHPHFFDDHMFNVVTRFGARSQYRAYRVDSGMNRTRIGAVNTRKPAYMHSFGMTENYIIVTEFPLVVNPLSLLFWLKPFIENFNWEPERGTPFYVFNRHTGELVGKYDYDPFFAFHHVNAFEKDNEIVMDIAAYPDADIVTHYYLNRLQDATLRLPHGTMQRFILPLNGTKVRSKQLSDVCIELPHFDYANYKTNADYHYVYGIGIHAENQEGFYNQLVKIDVQTGQHNIWYQPDTYPGEPIFVPDPDRQSEDHGVLLSIVLDASQGTSFLLVLDARSMQEIARAVLPQAVMFGFHGIYVADDQ